MLCYSFWSFCESHISHNSLVLPHCHHEQFSCFCKFSYCSFTKYTPCTVCLLIVMWKTCMFLWATIWPDFSEHFTRFCIKTKNLLVKVLNLNYRTISFGELLQIVNFDGLWTLMVWHFWQLWSYSTNQIIWTILTCILIAYCSILWDYRTCWQHFFHFANQNLFRK